jgi:hypothetical protein
MRVKKKCMIFMLTIMSAITASAQVRLGVEAGLNVSHAFDTSENKAGFNVGVIGDFSFNRNWAIDSELKLSSQPCGYYYPLFINSVFPYTVSDSYTPYYLTLPVRAKYTFGLSPMVKMSVAVGPMIGVGLFGKSRICRDNIVYKSSNVFDTSNWGYMSDSRFEYGANAKIGFEFLQNYLVSAEYSLLHIDGNLTAVDNMGIFSINLGYRF